MSGALLSGLQNRYSNSQSTRTTNTIEIELLVLCCQHKCFIIFQNVLTFYKTTIKGCQHVRVHFKVIVATRCTNRYKSPNTRVSVLRLLILSPDNQSGSRKVLGWCSSECPCVIHSSDCWGAEWLKLAHISLQPRDSMVLVRAQPVFKYWNVTCTRQHHNYTLKSSTHKVTSQCKFQCHLPPFTAVMLTVLFRKLLLSINCSLLLFSSHF